LFRWEKRYKEVGEKGLLRKPGSGRPRKLQNLSLNKLSKIIIKSAVSYGYDSDLWTIKRLQQVIKSSFKISVSKNTVWRRVREAGLTYQKPQKEYFQIDESLRKEWLKTVVPKIKRTVRKYKAILYFEDESNISLTSVIAKTWSPIGQTPTVRVTGNRGSIAAISAIEPKGKLVFKLHKGRIASTQIIDFLKQILKHHSRRHIVIVMDQAPPHTSNKTQSFIKSQKRLHVFYLPKYSPDWNPDEKVWNHLKHQELSNHQAKNTSELIKITRQKLLKMSRDPELCRGIFFRCCVATFFE
jgi:transposase